MSGGEDGGLKDRLEGLWRRHRARTDREWRRLTLYLCVVTALLGAAVALAIQWR